MFDPKAPELMDMIPHLLAVIREIADRSEFVKQLVSVLFDQICYPVSDNIGSTLKQFTVSCDATVQTSLAKLTLPHSEGLLKPCYESSA